MTRALFKALCTVLLAAAALPAAFCGTAGAQSLLSSRGLGYPLWPLDARARGLGGVGLGMPGSSLSLVNPAALGGLPAAGISVTYQPDFYDATAGPEQTDGSTSRFPVIVAAFPVRRFTAFLGYGSFLDQNWQVVRADSIDIGDERVGITDRFVSDGGVARFRAGLATQLGGRLAVGVAGDVFTGAVRDTSFRVFPDTSGFESFVSGTTFTYSGVGGSLGVRWTPSEALTLAGAVSGGGRIEAEADTGTVRKTYASPLTVDAGASGRITQNTLVALSGRWAGWSAADEDLQLAGGARDALSASAGLEWEGFQLAGRALPLRLGARYEQLPFRWGSVAQGNDFPNEMAVSAGLGARLAGGAAFVDLAAERGWRGGDSAGLDESFWRLSLSLSLLGR